MDDDTALLTAMFLAGVAAADPARVLAAHLPPPPAGRCVVVGAGKAAAAMAAALEAAWPAVPLSGVVVTRDAHTVPTARIAVREASHPVPDARGAAAAGEMLAAVRGLGPDDLVLALISGGGSALLTAPPPGLTLEDLRAVNVALLRSGAAIAEMNAVRKHLSVISGGRLARACAPALVLTLAISDVPGDDPSVIASGPTVADPTTFADACEVLRRHGIMPPPAVAAHLAAAADETPDRVAGEYRLIAAPMSSLRAMAAVAAGAGVAPLILGDALEGEARTMGVVMAGIALSARTHGEPSRAPCVLLSGGEATVTFAPGAPAGRGGRNTEFALALALALGGVTVSAIAGDSDGIDGTEDAAGAVVTPTTLARMRARGRDSRADLDAHDSYSAFAAVGDLVHTGPTLTNVNDLRAVLIR